MQPPKLSRFQSFVISPFIAIFPNDIPIFLFSLAVQFLTPPYWWAA